MKPATFRQPRATLRTVLRMAGALVVVTLLAAGAALEARRRTYAAEIDRLRTSMTAVERGRADEIVRREEHAVQLAIALLRRQARIEEALHLSISVDSARMYLERDGVLLRVMPVQIGPERTVGAAPDTVRLAAPRGVRTIVRVVPPDEGWVVPEWVFRERGLPVAAERQVTGALGSAAILLDGGTLLYALPADGPLADPAYVLPGAVRIPDEDLRAILPSLAPGMRVYFH